MTAHTRVEEGHQRTLHDLPSWRHSCPAEAESVFQDSEMTP